MQPNSRLYEKYVNSLLKEEEIDEYMVTILHSFDLLQLNAAAL
jgi:hypothetical protein